MLAIKIENKEFETKFLEFVKTQKKTIEDVTLDALKKFMSSSLNQKTKLIYTKKDPLKHMHKITREYDDDLCDEVALTHIKDSAAFIHNMRRQNNT